jgi:hypothetical protein
MEWQFILALIIVVPIILFPALFVWYLNVAGVLAVVRDKMRRRAEAKEQAPAAATK